MFHINILLFLTWHRSSLKTCWNKLSSKRPQSPSIQHNCIVLFDNFSDVLIQELEFSWFILCYIDRNVHKTSHYSGRVTTPIPTNNLKKYISCKEGSRVKLRGLWAWEGTWGPWTTPHEEAKGHRPELA